MTKTPRLSVLVLLAAALLLAGCQKGSPRSVSTKLGPGGDSKVSDADQIIDALIKDDKMQETCRPAFLETHTSLKILRKNAVQFIAEHKEKLNAADEKKAVDMSYEIQNKTTVLVNELVNAKVASCGKDAPVRLIDLKDDSNTVIIALADKIEKESKESELARKDKKRKAQKDTDTQSLIGQKFSISKDLAANLNEDAKARFVFFADGEIGSTKVKFDEAMSQTDKVVCAIDTAPKTPLIETAEFSVLKLEYQITEEKSDAKEAKDIIKRTTMLVRVSSGDQMFSFTCRLSGNMMQETGAKQFKQAFKDLVLQ